MAKKKSKKRSTQRLIVDALLILLAIVLICTLAMPMVSVYGEIFGQGATEFIGSTTFISDIFNGNITNGWAIVAMIAYFVTLLLAFAVLVFAVCDLLGIKINIPNKAIELLLVIFAVVLFITSIIYASTSGADGSFVIGSSTLAASSMSISWTPIIAPILGAGCVALKFFQK